jgi:PiT family inorganic phosphate transporter
VSSSQAIVGAVIGAGFARGTRIGNTKMVMRVVYGWVGTPIISGLMCVTMLGIISVFL